tara:strand:- start:42 stop:602 length:561 start_codon:yes stop_codon:yes gene_type:complete
MALTKIDVANAVTGVTATANGGTGVSTGVTANSMVDIFTFHNSVTAVQHEDGDTFGTFTRDATSGVGTLNAGMSESSGLWTFPSTGIYKVSYHLNVYSEGNDHFVEVKMNFTSDNGSNFVEHARDRTCVLGTSSFNEGETMRGNWYLNISNTSTHKFKWTIGLNRGTKISTGTGNQGSRFYFVKLT